MDKIASSLRLSSILLILPIYVQSSQPPRAAKSSLTPVDDPPPTGSESLPAVSQLPLATDDSLLAVGQSLGPVDGSPLAVDGSPLAVDDPLAGAEKLTSPDEAMSYRKSIWPQINTRPGTAWMDTDSQGGDAELALVWPLSLWLREFVVRRGGR